MLDCESSAAERHFGTLGLVGLEDSGTCQVPALFLGMQQAERSNWGELCDAVTAVLEARLPPAGAAPCRAGWVAEAELNPPKLWIHVLRYCSVCKAPALLACFEKSKQTT